MARSTPPRASPAVLLSSPVATSSFAAYVFPTATRCSMSRRALTPELHPRISGDSAYYGTFDNEVLMVNLAEQTHRLALSTPAAQVSLLFIGGGHADSHRRRRARQDGSWFEPRPARRPGLLRRKRGLNLRRLLPVGEFLSVQTTDGSTFSISTPAPSFGSLTPARRFPLRPPSPEAASSSAHRTDGCIASDEYQRDAEIKFSV